MADPVLAFPDHAKPFEVHTDASDYAIGGVLMQARGHPIAYKSRKLNDTERKYKVQEKEMAAIVHCLRTWRHYLLYFQTQKKLSPKQARWQDFLAEFDMCIEYKPGRTNLVADALSRKAELVSLKLQERTAVSQFRSTFSDRRKEVIKYDAVARSLLEAVKEEKRRFWEKDGLLYTKGNTLFVPRWDNIRMDLLKECHDTRWAGHPGQHRTMALLGARFYWPQMK